MPIPPIQHRTCFRLFNYNLSKRRKELLVNYFAFNGFNKESMVEVHSKAISKLLLLNPELPDKELWQSLSKIRQKYDFVDQLFMRKTNWLDNFLFKLKCLLSLETKEAAEIKRSRVILGQIKLLCTSRQTINPRFLLKLCQRLELMRNKIYKLWFLASSEHLDMDKQDSKSKHRQLNEIINFLANIGYSPRYQLELSDEIKEAIKNHNQYSNIPSTSETPQMSPPRGSDIGNILLNLWVEFVKFHPIYAGISFEITTAKAKAMPLIQEDVAAKELLKHYSDFRTLTNIEGKSILEIVQELKFLLLKVEPGITLKKLHLNISGDELTFTTPSLVIVLYNYLRNIEYQQNHLINEMATSIFEPVYDLINSNLIVSLKCKLTDLEITYPTVSITSHLIGSKWPNKILVAKTPDSQYVGLLASNKPKEKCKMYNDNQDKINLKETGGYKLLEIMQFIKDHQITTIHPLWQVNSNFFIAPNLGTSVGQLIGQYKLNPGFDYRFNIRHFISVIYDLELLHCNHIVHGNIHLNKLFYLSSKIHLAGSSKMQVFTDIITTTHPSNSQSCLAAIKDEEIKINTDRQNLLGMMIACSAMKLVTDLTVADIQNFMKFYIRGGKFQLIELPTKQTEKNDMSTECCPNNSQSLIIEISKMPHSSVLNFNIICKKNLSEIINFHADDPIRTPKTSCIFC